MSKNKNVKPKPVPAPWTAKFKEMATKINDTRRASNVQRKLHVPKIPQATLFVDGKKIILNA